MKVISYAQGSPILPEVHFVTDKFSKAARSLADSRDPMEHGPFADVFSRYHHSDAHFVTYRIIGVDGAPDFAVPRLTKSVLPEIRKAGGDVVMTMLALDWDTPSHVSMTRDRWLDCVNTLLTPAVEWPVARNWSLNYTTRKGLRLVYILSEPMRVEHGEAYHRWLVGQFNERGITLDPACSDWTRLFRLPYVVRDGRPTWEDGKNES